jgi:hypothetical protein
MLTWYRGERASGEWPWSAASRLAFDEDGERVVYSIRPVWGAHAGVGGAGYVVRGGDRSKVCASIAEAQAVAEAWEREELERLIAKAAKAADVKQ